MGFILIDQGNDQNRLFINFWNWRPTAELISSLGVIPPERASQLQIQTAGTLITKEEAIAIAARLDSVLSRLTENSRVSLDLRVTETTDDLKLHSDSRDYSASKDWLLKFKEFCRRSDGFKVL